MTKAVKSSRFAKPEEKNSPVSGIRKAIGAVVMFFYRARKIVMATPVALYAFYLAYQNSIRLPSEVGIFLQNNGNFLRMIDRGTAVVFPLLVTLGCLTLMMFSRKAMYAWAISIFSLALPLLILVSNVFPY